MSEELFASVLRGVDTESLFVIDIFVGFLTPLPFPPLVAATVDAHYGAAYHIARKRLAGALHAYSAQFGGLRNANTETAQYECALRTLHDTTNSFVAACQAMFDRVSSVDRASVPAVGFGWKFIEPALLFNDHYVSVYDADHETATSMPRDMQAEYEPPATAKFLSPSIVFEMCAALTLLVAVQLRTLASERLNATMFLESVTTLADTLKQLVRHVHLYAVVPDVESRGRAVHPLFCSIHFVEQALAPLIYSQALMSVGDASPLGRTANAACVKAVLANMSAELLAGDVAPNMPPLLCSSMQRAMLQTLANDRKASAYLNLGLVSLVRAARFTAEAAVSPEAEEHRRECLQVARAMIEMSRTLSDERSLFDCAETLYARVRVGLPNAPVKITPASTECWPIVALTDATPPVPLDARRLIAAAPLTRQCRLLIEDEPEQINVLLVEQKEQSQEQGAVIAIQN